MNELDKSKWKTFEFNKVFNFNRGKRLTTIDQTEGNIAYISSTMINNGIDNYINPPAYMKIYRNVLTVNNSGSVGYCFYHPYPIVCSDHCTVIMIKDQSIKMNPHIALFLKPIIESMKQKYSFAREISDYRLNKEKILLPADKEGNPDWKYMEEHTKKLSKNIHFNKIIKKINSKKINTTKWKEFIIEDLFKNNMKRGMRLIEVDRTKGDCCYYSASNKNNGLTDMIGNPLFIEKDAIIYSTFGDCFYVEGEFTASDEICILKHDKLNKFNGLYVVTILKENKYKYGFGRKAFLNKLVKDVIKLPADKEGNPDWEFRENYVKSSPYSSNL